MNPVLLKPGSDRRSHVVLMGQPAGDVSSRDWESGRRHLARPRTRRTTTCPSRFDDRRRRGCGQPDRDQPAGRRLREHGAGAARRRSRPSSSATSTGAGCSRRCSGRSRCSSLRTSALIAGFVVNKFRGDVALLLPRAHLAGVPDRAARVRRAAVGRGPVARLRGRARPRRVVGRRRRLAPQGRRRAAAADQQLHRRRRARARARPRRRLRRRPARPRRRRPGRAARAPARRSATSPGCGPAGSTWRSSTTRARSPGARHLRRVPDARAGRSAILHGVEGVPGAAVAGSGCST